MKDNTSKRVIAGALGLSTILFFNSCGKNKDVDYDNTLNESISNVQINYDETTDELTTLLTTKQSAANEDYIKYNETTKNNTSTTKYNETTRSDVITTKYYDDEALVNSIIDITDESFMISDELNNEIKKTINNFGKDRISFDIYDIETQNSFSYNLNGTYNGACIVKPSVVMYLCKLAENGLINLNDKIAYEGNVASGSGYLNGYYNGYQASYGQEFTILELMYHTLYYSDNNAYRLLHHYLVNSDYYSDYCNYMENINANSLKVNKDIIWVRNAQARDGVNVMKDLYNMQNESVNTFNVDEVFVDGNSIAKIAGKSDVTYGSIPYYIMANGKYDYIENTTGNYSITKTGFVSGSGSLSCRNLVSISYGKRTFLICLLTKGNSEDLRKSTVNKILPLLNEVINEYDSYIKENTNVLVKKNDR